MNILKLPSYICSACQSEEANYKQRIHEYHSPETWVERVNQNDWTTIKYEDKLTEAL